MQTQTDIAAKSLYPDHYGFGQSTVYKAFDELGIERYQKEGFGRQVFISFESKDRIDEYMEILRVFGRPCVDLYLKAEAVSEGSGAAYLNQLKEDGVEVANAAISDFLEQSAQPDTEIVSLSAAQDSAALTMPTGLVDVMRAIAVQMQRQPIETLAPQRQLQEAAEKGWVLSTNQVSEILGVKSWSGQERYGFSFLKTGKVGAQNGWKVTYSGALE